MIALVEGAERQKTAMNASNILLAGLTIIISWPWLRSSPLHYASSPQTFCAGSCWCCLIPHNADCVAIGIAGMRLSSKRSHVRTLRSSAGDLNTLLLENRTITWATGSLGIRPAPALLLGSLPMQRTFLVAANEDPEAAR